MRIPMVVLSILPLIAFIIVLVIIHSMGADNTRALQRQADADITQPPAFVVPLEDGHVLHCHKFPVPIYGQVLPATCITCEHEFDDDRLIAKTRTPSLSCVH